MILKEPKKLLICGAFGAAAFSGAFVVGQGLTLATGIPIMSSIANGLIVCFLLTIANFLTKRFGSSAIMMLIYGILAIQTVLLGPPGPYKVLVALAMGIVWDVVCWLGKYKYWTMPLSSALFMVTGIFGVLLAMVLFGLPGIERLRAAIIFIASVGAASGITGGILGVILFHSRLRKLRIFRSLTEN